MQPGLRFLILRPGATQNARPSHRPSAGHSAPAVTPRALRRGHRLLPAFRCRMRWRARRLRSNQKENSVGSSHRKGGTMSRYSRWTRVRALALAVAAGYAVAACGGAADSTGPGDGNGNTPAANDLFVSATTGNDAGAGTQQQPFQTIAAALAASDSGQTIRVAGARCRRTGRAQIERAHRRRIRPGQLATGHCARFHHHRRLGVDGGGTARQRRRARRPPYAPISRAATTGWSASTRAPASRSSGVRSRRPGDLLGVTASGGARRGRPRPLTEARGRREGPASSGPKPGARGGARRGVGVTADRAAWDS